MRLHRLDLRAFGPFADDTTVDFDALSAAGLFLLSGDTGAGKTSVLDAVCFALYGDVPGDRSTAKRLRCDQAGPGVSPQVTLEATLSGHRFKITRSPAWDRPKRRGTGLTRQQASVVIAEWVDDEWLTRSTRLDEAGYLIGEITGLNLDQFCQVAMLPQGRFQAFLRAGSEERHKLLQQLFRTGRFEAVEGWLRDHRSSLRKVSLSHREVIDDLVSRLSEVASWDGEDTSPTHHLNGLGEPDGQDGLDEPDGPARAENWAAALLDNALSESVAAEIEAGSSTAAADQANAALAQAKHLADLQSRHAAAVAQAARLDEQQPTHDEATARLAAAARADRVLPTLDHATAADQRALETQAEVARTSVGLADRGVVAESTSLGTLRASTLSAVAQASALAPRERRLNELRLAVDSYTDRIASLDRDIAEDQESLAAGAIRAESCQRELTAAQSAASRLEGARVHAQTLAGQQTASRQLHALAPQLADATAELAAAVDQAQRHTQLWLDLREQRLTQMAAEIAVGLAVGGCCPVCGSSDHPSPASRLDGAPDAASEREARRSVDDAETERHLRSEHLRDLTTRQALADQVLAGADVSTLAARASTAGAEVTALGALAASVESLGAELRLIGSETTRLTGRRDAALLERTGVEAAAAAQRGEAASIEVEVAAALADTPDVDLLSRADRLTALADACASVLAAQESADVARREQDRAQAAAVRSLSESGFVDADQARQNSLTPTARDRLAGQIGRFDASRLAASRLLDDDELTAAAGTVAPDVTGLAAVELNARHVAGATQTRSVRLRERCSRVQQLHGELAATLDAWRPVRADLDIATAMATFADGRSGDNRLQMRLSAYVLAYRLGQVVDAANLRLATMSDQRYSLVHTGKRGAGERRGGLSLLVRDDWSGVCRDPATLSGGETFVVSLALALGLADVITHESDHGSAGDSRLDTLFVDEGFGSLDADTLDDVMGTLDSLREGGRVIGVVSHVPAMRERIPTRLDVVKHRQGSRVRGPQVDG